jgi:hypothetical protein
LYRRRQRFSVPVAPGSAFLEGFTMAEDKKSKKNRKK